VRIGILLYDGVEELDVVGVWEVLRKAKQLHPALNLSVITRATKESIACALGLTILAHEVKRDLSDLDLLVVPGGPGRKDVIADRGLLEKVAEFGRTKPIASVCTGALILQSAGLLSGRRATTHFLSRHELTEADVVTDRVVVDGRVITAGGVSASIDLGLKILEMNFGAELADEVAARIEYVPAAGRPANPPV
jgi:transcriptional regulator GlxA family with amidase domain